MAPPKVAPEPFPWLVNLFCLFKRQHRVLAPITTHRIVHKTLFFLRRQFSQTMDESNTEVDHDDTQLGFGVRTQQEDIARRNVVVRNAGVEDDAFGVDDFAENSVAKFLRDIGRDDVAH